MKTIQLLSSIFILSFCLGGALMAQVQEDTLVVDKAGDKVEKSLDEAIAFAERRFVFGIKVGLNFSTFNAAETLEPDFQTDFHLGVFGRYQWTQRLSAKAELLYTSLGARADEFYTFSDYAINLDYLSLPILGELRVADNLRLELGPYIGVLVNSQQSFKALQPLSDPDPNDGQEPTLDFNSDDTNSVDIGFMAGVTYELSEGIGLGFRYQQGFTDALGDEFLRDASGANAAFQLSFQYTF